jgi:hypothetical protein
VSADSGPDVDGGKDADLCDLCGTLVWDSTEWNALVRDSSAVHPVDANFDGKRLVVGCSREHLAELVEQYKRRPFMYAELWAGKITRALRQHPKGISEEELARETGLSPDEIRHGVTWQNAELQRWLEQSDPERGSDPNRGQ